MDRERQPFPGAGRPPAAFDLLTLPVLGPLLKRRSTRTVLRLVMLAASVLMILHGLFGPQFAPKNVATLLTWVHFRGLLVLVLLVAGNFFCMACPLMLVRDGARRLVKPRLEWPAALRNKWVAIGLLVLILFAYELFDLWSSPWWTAWLIVAYFLAAVVVDVLFKGAAFCKFACPLGQFNFVASTLSPLEVKVRDIRTCGTCETADCIRGRSDSGGTVRQRGCELILFQPTKMGNMDCTFCLDCVYACPHDNIGIRTQLPGSELSEDVRRSGIGRLSRRKDLSALAVVFAFGAVLNAFTMVSPVYAVQAWLANVLGTRSEVPVLSILFLLVLVLEPLALLAAAAYLTRAALGSRQKLLPLAVRYSYALVPVGFGMWLAHYSFHFLTGVWTFIPAVAQLLVDLGLASPGGSMSAWRGLSPESVTPVQVGLLALGVIGSLGVAYRIAGRDTPVRAWWAFAPWASICLLLFASSLWVLTQPMEMRGTFTGG